MGGRGLCVGAGVAEVTELCSIVEVSLLCEKNSSDCVVHAGLRPSVIHAHGSSRNQTGIQVTSRAGGTGTGRETWKEGERDGPKG